jgi:hypothetical protein
LFQVIKLFIVFDAFGHTAKAKTLPRLRMPCTTAAALGSVATSLIKARSILMRSNGKRRR